MKKIIYTLGLAFCLATVNAQTVPTTIDMKNIEGGTFTMGNNSLMGSAAQQAAAPEHEVTLSDFSLSTTEITNEQYVDFLNQAYAEGLIEIVTGSAGPDNGKRLIQGTSTSSYSGKTLYTLDGTRVLKDHLNEDGDGDSFTGTVEPEHPLNVSYIDFEEQSSQFYIKNPHDLNDFNWVDICDYQDYGTTPRELVGEVLNDFEDWAGAGLNYSNELEGWTSDNPSAAVNLPTQEEVAAWPVTFVRWYGAKAFAEYFGFTLPTEAQWEYAAKAGQNFEYAVHDGEDYNDANWNTNGMGALATGHVRAAISGSENPFGLYNLAGNAWEWMADNYVEPYDTAAVTDPLIEDGSTLRSWRGGAWNYHQSTLQSAARFSDQEDRGNDHFGFRVAGENNLAIENITIESKLTIYPNPAENKIKIDLKEGQNETILIVDIMGRIVKEVNPQGTLEINISDLPSGVYFIKGNGETKRLLIK